MTMLTTAAAATVANVVSLPSAAAASVVPARGRQAGREVSEHAWGGGGGSRAKDATQGTI